jgi:predicted metal-dependent hydrolase
MPAVQFGTQTIEYELILMPRKTLAISVHPDLSVIVKAPEGTEPRQIEHKVQQRAAWIRKQQRQFEIFLPDVPPRQYVSGESHRYLGRQYRLKVIETLASEPEHIHLTHQFLEVHVHDKTSAHVREVVSTWYHGQAHKVFQERLAACLSKFVRDNLPAPSIVIRRMQSSWGSCSSKGTISLNIKLIQAPKEYIDYVLTHELCHLKQLNHGAEFYELLSRVMPNWQEKKEKLDRFDFG